MNPKPTPFLFGLFFILFGGFLLLGTADIIHIEGEMATAGLFAAAGLVLILTHFTHKRALWMLIVGGAALFIGAAIFIETTRVLPDDTIGALLFILVAAVFFLQLRKGRRAWWAVIPGGFSLVMAGHVLLNLWCWNPGPLHGVLFFGGTGLTFGIVYLMKNAQYKLDWALWPCAGGFIMAAFLLFVRDNDAVDRLFFPVMLIGFGLVILLRSLRASKGHPTETPQNDDIQ